MADIKSWSNAAADNDSAAPHGFPEGMAPGDVNNAARELMAAIRRWYEEAQWLDLGHMPGFDSSSSFTVGADVTSIYSVGRRVKIEDTATLYGTITASSYSAPDTTVTVVLDSGAITASIDKVALGILTKSDPSAPRGMALMDADADTRVQVEESADEDTIRFDTAGQERLRITGEGAFVGARLGGWELIESQTANNDASLDFTTGIDSTYDHYVVIVTDLRPATDGDDLWVRVSEDGGGTWKSGAAEYEYNRSSQKTSAAGINNAGNSTGDSKIVVGGSIEQSAGSGVSGSLEMVAPAAAVQHYFTCNLAHVHIDGSMQRNLGLGRYKGSTNPIDGVRLLFSSGSITSGTAALYGLRK